ncbi:MoaD/ThiS family protein [Rhodococcus aerolatus]
MAQTDTGTTTGVRVTVRFFAAARAAAGAEQAEHALPAGTASVADLVVTLGEGRPELARVLARCSFLVDEVAVRDRSAALRDGAVVDVLPPFAGG